MGIGPVVLRVEAQRRCGRRVSSGFLSRYLSGGAHRGVVGAPDCACGSRGRRRATMRAVHEPRAIAAAPTITSAQDDRPTTVGRARGRRRAGRRGGRRTGSPSAGHRVLVVEKKRFPREKTCGDGLTPRAVRQLDDMGLAEPLAEYHRFDGLRSIAHGVTLELAVARAPRLPALRLRGAPPRPRRDGRRRAAVKAGATLWPGAEAVEPLVEDGLVARRGRSSATAATTEAVRARYVVVADGANSRFGRALGTARDRTTRWAWRSAATSPARSTTSRGSRATSTCATATATTCPGYGWIFPVGDGTVNVGVGLLSTFTGWKTVNTSTLMDAFVATAPARWGISPETSCGPPTGGKLPTGGSVDARRSGPPGSSSATPPARSTRSTARASRYAYETGRMAADAVDEALAHRRRPRARSATPSSSRRVRPLLQGGPRCSCGSSATPR